MRKWSAWCQEPTFGEISGVLDLSWVLGELARHYYECACGCTSAAGARCQPSCKPVSAQIAAIVIAQIR